jgi:hypothetical protein
MPSPSNPNPSNISPTIGDELAFSEFVRFIGAVRERRIDGCESGANNVGWSEVRHRDSVRAGADKQVEVGTARNPVLNALLYSRINIRPL